VDAQQSTSAQHFEDRGALVCYESAATSNSTRAYSRWYFGNDIVQSASSVRDLDIYLDSEASMKTHVSKTMSCCFNVLRQIRSIRRSVTRPVLQSLVVSMASSRLDYGNATLAGLSGHELMNRLQSVLNAAARLIFYR